jgi:demethylmenaquinone methyltransferase/2-methoxy-6-polyprenyl-1,4-benzoquinol methylase
MTGGIQRNDIQQLFNTIATEYDITNLVISFGWSVLWYRAFIKAVLKDSPPQTVLDLCCGTGAITRRLAREMKNRNLLLPTIDCVDFSEKMLEQARKKLHQQNLYPRFINADATAIPIPDASYDTITIAYGIRTLTEKKKALIVVTRLLKPHGNLFILELTTPRSLFVRRFHTVYMKTVMPLVGRLLTRHKKPYQYLDHSIEQFSLPDLLQTLHDVGLSCRNPISLSFGIATIIQAEKI